MTAGPRELRSGIRDGVLQVEKGPLPPPPVEWREWKREKMARDAQAAYLFLVKRLTLEKIAVKMGLNGESGTPLTKARIQQYVKRGCRFLVDRRYVRKAK